MTFSKLITVSALLLFCFLRLSNAADEPGYCSDMTPLACDRTGKINDGTGWVNYDGRPSAPASYKDLILHQNKIQKELDSFVAKLFDAKATRNQKQLLDQAASAFGYNICKRDQNSEVMNDSKCQKSIAMGLMGLVERNYSNDLSTKDHSADNLDDWEYVQADPQFHDELKNIQKILLGENNEITAAAKKLKTEVVPNAKGILKDMLTEFPIDAETKEKMIRKVSKIEINDDATSESCSGLMTKYVVNANYDISTSHLNVCEGILAKATSEFTMAFVVGHEICHSIDPCEIAIGPSSSSYKYKSQSALAASSPNVANAMAAMHMAMDEEYPLKGLVSCLRSPNSVEAQTYIDVSQLHARDAMLTPTFCPHGSTETGVVQGDQILEAVPDWCGAEIMLRYIKAKYNKEKKNELTPEQIKNGIANTFRIMCDNWTSHPHFDTHPATKDRLNKIVMANPRIRELIGCEPHPDSVQYCQPFAAATSYNGTKQIYSNPARTKKKWNQNGEESK